MFFPYVYIQPDNKIHFYPHDLDWIFVFSVIDRQICDFTHLTMICWPLFSHIAYISVKFVFHPIPLYALIYVFYQDNGSQLMFIYTRQSSFDRFQKAKLIFLHKSCNVTGHKFHFFCYWWTNFLIVLLQVIDKCYNFISCHNRKGLKG